MIIAEWWLGMDVVQRVFWSIALVSSVLLFILMMMSLYIEDVEHEDGRSRYRSRWLEPKTVLMALTLLGWSGVLAYALTGRLEVTLLLSMLGAILGAVLPWWLAPILRGGPFDPENARSTTGRVLRSVPPHRNGFGKVHLNLRAAPFELDAVTAGEELPPGAAIRVVEILDERVVLVEAADRRSEQEEKGPSPTDLPPAARGPAS